MTHHIVLLVQAFAIFVLVFKSVTILAEDLQIPPILQLPLDENIGGDVADIKMYSVGAYVKVNWFTAQQICSQRGMTLATLETAAQVAAVNNFINQNGLGSNNFWTSGTTLSRQGNWFWFSTGTPIATYTNWASENVKNQMAPRCLAVTGTGVNRGRWEDANCETNMNFICENRCPLTSYELPLYKRK